MLLSTNMKKKTDQEEMTGQERLTIYREFASMLPPRTERSNKGTYGTLLLAAGSKGMGGAAVLSAMAAYRMGTGIVAVLSEESNRIILQSTVPEAIFKSYQYPIVLDHTFAPLATKATALAAGPGIGTSETAGALMKKLLPMLCEKPAVLDADALNLLAAGLFSLPSETKRADIIITPHPGEMARLTGLSASQILADPVPVAESYAAEHGIICVLKDHRSVITNGTETYLNPTGCDGMATAGSGDVLTGMIGALLAQGCEPMTAARLGVFLHGLAGELAQEQLGARSVMARDIIEHIPEALQIVSQDTGTVLLS